MILKKRLFERAEPSEDAKKIFIFCEGKKREKSYFNYFKEIDSRINIEVYELDGQEDNSPLGLYKIAISSIFGDPDNGVLPKYDARASDEVWLVIDVDTDKFDSRTPQIAHINTAIAAKSNWALVKSNPCFEVWLYYHLFSAKSVSKIFKN